MVKCKSCGKEIAKSAKACPHCGAKQKHHRFLIFLLVVIIIVVIAMIATGGSTPKLSKQYESMSESQIRENSITVNYEDVARNPSDYKGKLVSFQGKVIQVIDGSTVVLRINQDKADSSYSSDTWYVVYKMPAGSSRILENDKLQVFGECTGTTSYRSAIGASITIPSMIMLYYDIVQ